MDITFDPAKNASNILRHGISMESAVEFEWNSAAAKEDLRRDYGERRYRALGYIGPRLHMLVFTPRDYRIHVISLRKANRRELRRYEEEARSKTHTNGS